MRKTLVSLIAVAVTVPLVAVFAEKAQAVSKTFKVGADCKIVLAGEKAGALADLKAGDEIAIAYHEDGATVVADKIRVSSEDKAAGKGVKAHDGSKKADVGGQHARGTITAVDATAGTVTAEVHIHRKKEATK